MVDFVRHWSNRTEISIKCMLAWLCITKSKFYSWQERYGKVNEHNAWGPRDHWLTQEEKQAILDYHDKHPLEGYRRLTYQMLDADVVAVSPSSTYRVLKEAGLLDRWNKKISKKGTGFNQPTKPHKHWHNDVSYINIQGTFYYLCTILDGYSRYIVHWELKEAMKSEDIELIIQRGLEKHPGVTPRIISDNGPQYIANDFKAFIKQTGMSHVRTSPYYPQSNGKIERWHKTIKSECIRQKPPESLDDAIQLIEEYVAHYNKTRLHSAIGYITPLDKLEGKEENIFKQRNEKLHKGREKRKMIRKAKREAEMLAQAV